MRMTEPNQVTMDDTRYLLPSEIARLVYGYLKENHCDEVAEKFLNTSPHMKECLEMRNNHRTFMTKAHNLTLEEISNQCLRMNEMLLEAVNRRINQPKKFHDPVEALRFITDPSSLKDCSLVTDEPMTVEDDPSSDICFDLNSSPERTERSDGLPNLNVWSELTLNERSGDSRLSNLNIWSESTSKALGILDGCEKTPSSIPDDSARPGRNLNKNAVLNKCGKVKVLRPRHTLPVVGKTITRRVSDEQEPTSSRTVDNPVSTDLEPPSPESPLREDDNFVSESLAAGDSSPMETAEEATVNVTTRLPTPPAKASEDAATASSRFRRCRKKSSGSWNGEQMSLSKSSCSKIVPEIEKGHMLIQQTLIKNPKIHERIAENINKAISESPLKKMIIDPIDELNSTVKKVADETMNDPLCKDIINELLSCLTNVNLGLENETDDVDNLTFADKIYGNAASNGSNFQSDEPVGTNVPSNETNSNYQSLHDYVTINSQQRETEMIFVGEMPENNENYGVENQENTISNSNVDIRSYFTSTPDIKEGCDNVETINGTVINILEPNCTNLIPVHGVEAANQYCIARTVPLFIGGTTTSTVAVAPVAVDSKKRSARIQPCVFPTSRAGRRLMPIAPKPSATADAENRPEPVRKNSNSRRPAKRIKK